MPLLLLGIVTIAFCISRLIPADPLVSIVGERQLNNEEVVAAAKARSGASTASLPEQYVIVPQEPRPRATSARRSAPAKPVTHDLLDRLPATLELDARRAADRRRRRRGARRLRRAPAGQARRPHQPRRSRCSARRCPCSGSGSSSCPCSTPGSAGSRVPGDCRRAPSHPITSPASTRSTRCSTATSGCSGSACTGSCCPASCSAGRTWARSRGSCGRRCSTRSTPTTCAPHAPRVSPSGW